VVSAPKWRQLADRVIADIGSGRAAPGSKLPSLRELEDEGFSQGPVLQAYRWLAARGYVVSRHGMGTFVADEPPAPEPAGGPSNAELAERLTALEGRLDAHLRRHEGGIP
jgi:DNA-binding GntR family transcriptional regulator